MDDQQPLWLEPDDVCHVHMRWTAATGWEVWINSWVELDGPRAGARSVYDQLSLAEALQVLDDDLGARLWGRRPLRSS